MIYFQHIALALVMQVVVWRLSGSWWAGAGLAAAYFIGREVAQAEYRWIEHFGLGKRANMPWWAPFDRRVWTTLDQVIDWLGPLMVTCGLAWFMSRR